MISKQKRLLVCLLALVMVLGMMPSAAFADTNANAKASSKTVSLGNTALTTAGYPRGWNTADGLYVYFGQFKPDNKTAYEPTAWRLLKADNNTAFLDADEILWQDHYADGETSASELYNIIWQGTHLQKKMNGADYYLSEDVFSPKEKSLIQKTSHVTDAEYEINFGNPYATDEACDDYIFALSCKELETLYAAAEDRVKTGVQWADKPVYWLRSKLTYSNPNGIIVCWDGAYDWMHKNFSDWNGPDDDSACPIFGASPAMNIDISSVAFTTKSGVSHSTPLFSNPVSETADRHWVLTLVDDNTAFVANRTDSNVITAEDGGMISLAVSGETATSNQLSGMVLDSQGSILYYGKIAEKDAETVNVDIPSGLAIGRYTLKVFSEQANADKYTGYASNMVDIPFTVKGKLTDVVLTPNAFDYDRSEKTPTLTVQYKGKNLTENTDYTVTGTRSAAEVGTYTITVAGIGDYTGTVEKTWSISKKSFALTVTMQSYTFGETPSTPVADGNTGDSETAFYYSTYSDLAEAENHRIAWTQAEGAKLRVGTYYMIAYAAETDAYAESISETVPFQVTPGKYAAPTAPTVSGFTVTIAEADRDKRLEYSLDGTNWTTVPKLSVSGSFELAGLAENKDYTISLRQKASADGNYDASDAVSTAFTTPAKYSVAYHANYGTGKVPASVTKNSGETVTVASGSGLQRTGYAFSGWNTQADGKGKAYQTGDTISSGATLYAQWTANRYTVQFDANGGSGTMAEQEFTYDSNAETLHQNSFTKENYSFAGWALSAGGAVTYIDGQRVKNLTAEGSVTLYAVWVENQYKITVNIRSDATSDVTLTLMRGNAQIGAAQTVQMSGSAAPYTGTYVFTDIPAGTYNIVATQDNKSVTVLAVVTGQDRVIDIVMPRGETNSKLEVKEDTPSVVVGGLDQEAENEAEANKIVTITMTVEKQEEQALPETAAETEKTTQEAIADIKAEASGKTLEFMNIEVEKEVKHTLADGETKSETKKLSRTNTVMEIVIPFDLTDKKNITVYRYHDGRAETFNQANTRAEGTFYLDTANDLIYVYAQKFSTYAIGYNTGSGGSGGYVPITKPDSGKTDETDDQPGEEPSQGEITKEEVQNTKFLARSQVSSLHGYYAVRVKWFRTDGRLKPEDFDGFEIQRSQQRSSGYQTIYRTDGKLWYKNNAHLQIGKKYYYRVRCYKVIDGEKVYTKWSWKAWRTVKAKDVKAKGGLLVLKDK